MSIEIHQPELEALIQQRMQTGHFQSIEDVLLHALKNFPEQAEPPTASSTKPNLAQFLMDSPLRGSGLTFERNKDYPRPVDW